MTTSRRMLAFISIGCLVAFALLGIAVTHGATAEFDQFCTSVLFGRAPGFATALAQTGYVPWLVVASFIGFAVVRILRGHWWLPLAIIVLQLVSQGLVESIKGIFARARPEHWLGVHELGFSYPSGHATTAIVFYGSWALALASTRISAPIRALGCGVLVLWSVALDLSRIALGAHYGSDVLGGNLFGIACVALTIAIVLPRIRRAAVVR